MRLKALSLHSATLSERTHDVALGHDASDAVFGIHHDQSTNPTFGEHMA
jgi:hypothetical protein